MRRRDYLHWVAAGSTAAFAGCETPRDEPPAKRSQTTIRPPENGPVAVVVPDPQPDGPFEHAVEFQRQPSEPEPAKLTVRVRNADTVPHRLQTNYYAFPFPDGWGERVGGDAALVLTGHEPERKHGCWRAQNVGQPAIRTVDFEPNESVQATYALVNHVDNDDCWPAGTYEFSQRYGLDPENAGDAEKTYTWGFDVVVE